MKGYQAVAAVAGLSDPVFDCQSIFRSVLEAVSNPGRIVQFPVSLNAVEGLNQAACGIALTLCDIDTAIWLGPSCDSETTREYLALHAGADIVQAPELADFAFVCSTNDLSFLERLQCGTDSYPDRSATLIMLVDDLSGDSSVVLRGPGIPDHRVLAPTPINPAFWQWNAASHKDFPLGVDVIFASETALTALPRSTRVGI